MPPGPTSRLDARRDFAYRLFDAWHDAAVPPKPRRPLREIDRRREEIEQELLELFGPRPEPEDRAVIRARTEDLRTVTDIR